MFGAHLSVGDDALIIAVVAYVVSIVRDWRPIRALREENRDLRATLEQQEQRYNALEHRYSELERKCAFLEKSRDFGTAFEPLSRAIDQARADSTHEHEKILGALEAVVGQLGELAKGLASNSAVTAALAAGINAGTVAPHQEAT